MLIRLRDRTGRFDKFIFLNGTKDVHLKFNDQLYLAWEAATFYLFLSQLISAEKLHPIVSPDGKLIKGNIDAADLLIHFPFFSSPDFYLDRFKLAQLGIEFDRVAGRGHLEIKYQHKDDPHWWLTQNLHVYPDKFSYGRTVADYLRILLSQHKKFLALMRNELAWLSAVTLGNFRLFGFSIALKSEPYYEADLLGAEDVLTESAYRAALIAKRTIFAERVAALSSDYLPFDDEAYPLPDFHQQIDFLGFELEEIMPDYAFLDLTRFPLLFAGRDHEYSISADCHASDTTIGVKFRIASIVRDAIFAHADLRGMDLRETCFVNTDFTAADLRGASFDVMKMDEASLLTLANALLPGSVKKIVLGRLVELESIRAKHSLEHPAQLCLDFETKPVILACNVSRLVSSSPSACKRAIQEAYTSLEMSFTLFASLSRARKEGDLMFAEPLDEDEKAHEAAAGAGAGAGSLGK